MSLFFNETSVFKAHDKFKLFTLHASNLALIKLLLIGFLWQLAFDLGTSAVLPFNKVHVALLHGFVLLMSDHHLHLLRFLLLNASVMLPILSVGHFLSFGVISFILGLGYTLLFVLSYGSFHLFFGIVMKLCLVGLLGLTLLFAVLAVLVIFNIAATLVNDVVSAFSSLINFFNGL
jgi:hypothetical protein